MNIPNISYHNFALLWEAALSATDRELFVSEWRSSAIWGEPWDIKEKELIYIADYCMRVYEIAHMEIKEMIKKANMTQTVFAERFCIPKRTVENWCGKTSAARKPTDWQRLLIARQLGFI